MTTTAPLPPWALHAHEATAQCRCSWCGAPCDVEPAEPCGRTLGEQTGHIRVPNCGCAGVEVEAS